MQGGAATRPQRADFQGERRRCWGSWEPVALTWHDVFVTLSNLYRHHLLHTPPRHPHAASCCGASRKGKQFLVSCVMTGEGNFAFYSSAVDSHVESQAVEFDKLVLVWSFNTS